MAAYATPSDQGWRGKSGALGVMLLWVFTEDDAVRGLRDRGLPLDGVDDLTVGERCLMGEYVDMAFNKAARDPLHVLAVHIRRDRGSTAGAERTTPSETTCA